MNVEHFRCPLDDCTYWRAVDVDAAGPEALGEEDTALREHFEGHSSREVLDAMRAMVRERAALRRVADKVRPER